MKLARDSADAEQERAVTNGKTPTSARLIASRGSDGRLTGGPGTLLASDVGVVSPDAEGKLLAEYALAHGLRPSARRPSIPAYIAQLWRRAHFIVAFATARNIAMYTEARLGQLWQVLTPLLNAGVYWLIFGELLHINRGIPNYLGFVVTGVFVFNYTQRAFISTSTVITTSLPLIRALQFPRAALPLAYVIIELQQMLVSLAVLVPILLVTGEPLTWQWLLVIPVLLLQTMFNVGAGLAVARLGSQVNDFAQLLPFLMRTWLYMSGVIFSIASLTGIKDKIVALLQINPAALYITLSRNALMATQRQAAFGSKPYSAAKCELWKTLGHDSVIKVTVHGKVLTEPVPKMYQSYSAYCHYVGANPSHFWWYAIAWSVAAFVIGFYFFWRAETRYGRG